MDFPFSEPWIEALPTASRGLVALEAGGVVRQTVVLNFLCFVLDLPGCCVVLLLFETFRHDSCSVIGDRRRCDKVRAETLVRA